MSVLGDATARYSSLEAWAYDRAIAPAVLDLARSLNELVAAAPTGAARVLEVGCGGGQLAGEILRQRPDIDYTGLDLSPDQVRRASRRVPAARFVEGSALDLPFDDGCFDLVVSVASLKHWPDKARGLGECVRVLAPAGTLMVVEADRGCRYEDSRAFVRRWRMLGVLRPLGHVMFRALVAGQSVDLDDARELLAALELEEASVERIPGTPGLMMRGTKPRQ